MGNQTVFAKRRLIICLDGTWNEPEEKSDEENEKEEPTNVLKIVRGVSPVTEDGVSQIIYYHTGVGTGGFFDKMIGGGLGTGLSDNIMEAYRFIANNHVDGDEIFLFGFSRGAYSARALAGLIGAVGLLAKEHLAYLADIYAYYRTPPAERENSPGRALLEGLNPLPRKNVPIEFIGVWDTVGALGAPTPLLKKLTDGQVGFHDTELGKDVRNAFQALAISEERRSFKPDLWTGKLGEGQVVEQVWFPGVHSNVGGSYASTVLSNGSLKWMVDKASQCGLLFNDTLTSDLKVKMSKEPIANARIENSFTWGYQILRIFTVSPYKREIGADQIGDEKKSAGLNESVHEFAVDAIGKTFHVAGEVQAWQPENLIKAIESGLPTTLDELDEPANPEKNKELEGV